MWHLLALAFPLLEVIKQFVPLSMHLCRTSVVFLFATAAESSLPTPPLAEEAFVMVLLGFGDDWAAFWRLLAMVRVAEIAI